MNPFFIVLRIEPYKKIKATYGNNFIVISRVALHRENCKRVLHDF